MSKILVVEDEPLVLMFVAEALEMAGHTLVQARNGEMALDLFMLTDGIDAVVTDIRMPKLSGFELASTIRKLRPELPVVFMSGYVGDSVPNEFSHAPVLVKLFAPDLLVKAVQSLTSPAYPGQAHDDTGAGHV